MIYATVNVTIGEYESVCDKLITLYRGDKNVEIRFVMHGNRFTVLDNTYAQMIIKRPSAASIFSAPALIQNDTVVFLITDDMIDELKEIGAYTFQIRLYDDNMVARVTLPPCYSTLFIEKPIAVEGESIVNLAMVNDSAVMLADTTISEEDIFTEDGQYNKTMWKDGDLITDAKLNKIEEALHYINENGGGGGGATAPYISSELPENIIVPSGNNFDLPIDYYSPNFGKGTLKVFINDVESVSKSIEQGVSTTIIDGDKFSKGTNRVVVYVIDRVGVMSNSLVFYLRYGSTEITSDFDPYSAYDYGSIIRYYFTPTSVDTSLSLSFYMSIDGTVQKPVSCKSDVRGYFTFPMNLSAGKHYCEAYVIDSENTKSNVLKFNLIILQNNTLVVASDTADTTIEEGAQLTLDYKVYMKNNSSFITEVYVDNNLVNTGTCGLDFNEYKTSSLTEGTHSIKLVVYDVTRRYRDSIIWTVVVTASAYEMLQPVNAGAIFIGTAVNKSNADERRQYFIGHDQEGNEILGTLTNFAFNSESGWVDDELIISGNSYAEIPIQPLANNAKYGFTLDIEFTSKQIGVPDAEVLTLWNYETNCGIRITTEKLILQSSNGNKCDLYFTDNEKTHVMFIIDRQELKAKIYLNGVMCEAFHLNDYTVDGVAYLDDFTVNSNIILGGLNTNGYCKIRNLRVYQVALTTDEIMNNFISCEIDKTKQRELSEFQKGNDLPTLYVYCDFSGLGKDDKKPCKIVYNSTNEELYGKSFNLDHKQSQLQYQGTSSMAYPIKNYRLNLRDENGDKWYYTLPTAQPECRFTLKADFMSSGHWTNTGMAKFINDKLYNYNVNDEKSMNPFKWNHVQNGGKVNDFRETITGFPCRLILVNDGETPLNTGQNEPTPGNTKDMGIFNFNNDKDNVTTLGFNSDIFPNCASYEVTANSDTSAGAFMSYKSNQIIDNSGELAYLKESFELRHPDADDVAEDWGFMGIPGEEGTGLKALIDWVDNCTDEEFVADFEQHFHKDYTLRYFCLVTLIGAVDNLGKNMMLDTADSKIYFPRFYDIDTICSYDNSGQLKFDVDIEMEQGYWNTSSSRLWTRIRDLMHDDIVTTYNNMRQNGVSYENMMHYIYDEQIAKIPQTYYNKDYDVKYAPFADSYIGMAHGDTYEHIKRWLKQRFAFVDTLFDYAPSYNNDILTIRVNTTEEITLHLETYTPVYQHLSWYNGQMDKKKIDGKTSITFSGKVQAATDQEVLIYGGSNIKKISGIQSGNPNRLILGSATKLTELDASNCPLLSEINMNKANLSPHEYLNKVNLSNCPLLEGNLRLNNSPLIQELDIRGTNITGMNLPSSIRNLQVLKLPNTMTELSLNDAGMLHTLEFDEGVKMQSVAMSNCNALTNVVNFDLLNTPTISLDNSYNSVVELYFMDTNNLTLKNMSNLERVIFTPNNEYATFELINVANAPDYKVTTFNCPKLSTFMTTAPYRESYNNCDEVQETRYIKDYDNLVDILIDKTPLNAMVDTQTGAVSNSTSGIHYTSQNYIEVEGDTEYTINITSGASGRLNLAFYNNSLEYIEGVAQTNSWSSYTFTTPSKCCYIRYHMHGSPSLFQASELLSPSIIEEIVYKKDYGDIQPNTTFTANSIDISSTQFTDVKLLCTTDTNTLKLPTTVKNFYCDSSFDLDTDWLEDGEYDVVHGELIEPYTTDYEGEVLKIIDGVFTDVPYTTWKEGVDLHPVSGREQTNASYKSSDFIEVKGGTTFASNTQLYRLIQYRSDKTCNYASGDITSRILQSDTCYVRIVVPIDVTNIILSYEGVLRVTPNLIPSSADGSLIFSMYAPSNTVAPASGIWDLKGLEFDNFHTFGMNNDVKTNYTKGTISMPARYDDYNISIKNAYISPKTHNTMLYPLLVNEDNPITGTLDYTNYAGKHLSWSFAYTDEEYVDIIQPKYELLNSYKYRHNAFYDTEFEFENPYEIARYTSSASGMLPGFNAEFTYTYDEIDNGDGTYTISVYADSLDNLPTSISFNAKTTLLTIDKLNTSKVTSMVGMFNNCSELTSLDASGFDTSNVTSMYYMFEGCFKLTNLDLSNFVTSKVLTMNNMFSNCSSLTSLDISNWDTANVTDISGMFRGCKSLTNLHVPKLCTNKVTNIALVFHQCEKLETITGLETWDTSNVTKMGEDGWKESGTFQQCRSLKALDISNWDLSKCKIMYKTFCDCEALETLKVDFTGSKPNVISYLFSGNAKLPEIQGLNTLDISEVTQMDTLFTNCKSLTSDALACTANWKLAQKSQFLLQGCSSLTSVDFASNWDVSDAVYMNQIFANCSNLTKIDLSKWNVSKALALSNMFDGCEKLTELKLNFTVNNAKLNSFIAGCASLTDLSNMVLSGTTSDINYFAFRVPATTLDLSGLDMSAATTDIGIYTFINSKIVEFYPPTNINVNIDIRNTATLSTASIVRIFNSVMTTTETRTIILGSVVLNKLTENQIAIATNKGWTVTTP